MILVWIMVGFAVKNSHSQLLSQLKYTLLPDTTVYWYVRSVGSTHHSWVTAPAGYQLTPW